MNKTTIVLIMMMVLVVGSVGGQETKKQILEDMLNAKLHNMQNNKIEIVTGEKQKITITEIGNNWQIVGGGFNEYGPKHEYIEKIQKIFDNNPGKEFVVITPTSKDSFFIDEDYEFFDFETGKEQRKTLEESRLAQASAEAEAAEKELQRREFEEIERESSEASKRAIEEQAIDAARKAQEQRAATEAYRQDLVKKINAADSKRTFELIQEFRAQLEKDKKTYKDNPAHLQEISRWEQYTLDMGAGQARLDDIAEQNRRIALQVQEEFKRKDIQQKSAPTAAVYDKMQQDFKEKGITEETLKQQKEFIEKYGKLIDELAPQLSPEDLQHKKDLLKEQQDLVESSEAALKKQRETQENAAEAITKALEGAEQSEWIRADIERQARDLEREEINRALKEKAREDLRRTEEAKKIEEAQFRKAEELMLARESIRSDAVAARYGFEGKDAIVAKDNTVTYKKGDEYLRVNPDGTSTSFRKRDDNVLYSVTLDDKGKPKGTYFNEDTLKDLSGSYSNNKEIINGLHKQGLLTDEQYNNARGEGTGFFADLFDTEDDIQDVLKTVKQNIEQKKIEQQNAQEAAETIAEFNQFRAEERRQEQEKKLEEEFKQAREGQKKAEEWSLRTDAEIAALQGTPIALKSEAASWWQHQEATFSWDQGKGKWIATVGGNKYLADDLENQYWMPKDIIEKGKELMKFAPGIKKQVQGVQELEEGTIAVARQAAEDASFVERQLRLGAEQAKMPPEKIKRQEEQVRKLFEQHKFKTPEGEDANIGTVLDDRTGEPQVYIVYDENGNVEKIEPADPKDPGNIAAALAYDQELKGKTQDQVQEELKKIPNLKVERRPFTSPVEGKPAAAPGAPATTAADVQKQVDKTTKIVDDLTKIVEQNDARIKELQDKIADVASYNKLSDEEKNELNKQLRNAMLTRDKNKKSLDINKDNLAKLQAAPLAAPGATSAGTPPKTTPTKGINWGAIFGGDDAKKAEAEKKKTEYEDGLKKIKAKENEIAKLEEEGAKGTPNTQVIENARHDLNELRKQNVETYNQMITLRHEGEDILKNTVSVMRSLMKAYDAFPGIGRLSSLFLTSDDWTDWRNDVNKVLCDTIILGGKQCWISKICDQYIDATPGGNSLIARTPGGPKGVVNLQAERSLPIEVPGEGTQFIYKLTYTITNPHDKPMHYNLRFHTKDGTYEAFKPQKEIQPGGSDGKTGSAAFHKQSNKDYTQVCLVWSPSIEAWDKRSVSEFCEPITQYEGAATNPYTNLPTQPGTCSDGLRNQGETGTDCGGSCPACGTATKPTEFDGF